MSLTQDMQRGNWPKRRQDSRESQPAGTTLPHQQQSQSLGLNHSSPSQTLESPTPSEPTSQSLPNRQASIHKLFSYHWSTLVLPTQRVPLTFCRSERQHTSDFLGTSQGKCVCAFQKLTTQQQASSSSNQHQAISKQRQQLSN